jgi:hypothetical protein
VANDAQFIWIDVRLCKQEVHCSGDVKRLKTTVGLLTLTSPYTSKIKSKYYQAAGRQLTCQSPEERIVHGTGCGLRMAEKRTSSQSSCLMILSRWAHQDSF